jgi:hypothetical protein
MWNEYIKNGCEKKKKPIKHDEMKQGSPKN